MGKHEVITADQSVGDILSEIHSAHKYFSPDYDQFALDFWTGDPLTTAKFLFAYLKKNVRYQIEPENFQSSRSPGAIIEMGFGDCKHYAQFIAGVLDSIRRQLGLTFGLYYRYASYKLIDNEPEHVFVILKINGQSYWVDPVLSYFDAREPEPTFHIDKKIPMSLVRISGAGAGAVLVADDVPVTNVYSVPTSPATIPTTFNPETSPLNVQYLVNGQPLNFPMKNGEGKLPPALPDGLTVVYPLTWGGTAVPPVLPRPMSVGKRLVLLPKSFTQDVLKQENFKWLTFLVRVLKPLTDSYSLFPNRYFVQLKNEAPLTANTSLGNTIFYDLDERDIIDYVGNMPTVLPITAGIPEGVKFYESATGATGSYTEFIPGNRIPGEPPLQQPKYFWCEYPAYYHGKKVPDNLPRPTMKAADGRIEFYPKGIDGAIMKADYYFWLAFCTSVMAVLVRAYATNDYSWLENKLADRLYLDCDASDPVQDYRIPPPDDRTFLEKWADAHKKIFTEVGKFFVTISMLLPRQAFMLLCRVNLFGWGRKFHQAFQDYEKFNKIKDKWEAIGGNFTNLVDACENGREKVDLDPDHPNQAAWDAAEAEAAGGSVGAIGGRIGYGVTEAIILAATCIAAMAPVLKLFTDDKTDAIIDGAVGATNGLMIAAGYDPISVGNNTGSPTKVIDPITGQEIIIPPPGSNTSVRTNIWDLIRNNPVATGVGVLLVGGTIYYFSNQKKFK